MIIITVFLFFLFKTWQNWAKQIARQNKNFQLLYKRNNVNGKKSVQESVRVSRSNIGAANYCVLLVDTPSFVPAIPQERDS